MGFIPNLTDEAWNRLTTRLLLYAHNKMVRLHWRGIRGQGGGQGGTPGGIGPDDIVHEAIELTIEGTRTYRSDTEPYAHFCGVIDSLVSHLVEAAENRKSRVCPTETENGKQVYETQSREPNSLQVVIDEESAASFQKLIFGAVEKDRLAAQLLECYQAEITKPQEIAELLGLSVDEVNSAKKRLRRATESVLKTYDRGIFHVHHP